MYVETKCAAFQIVNVHEVDYLFKAISVSVAYLLL